MHIDANGEVLNYEICEGVIRSARRMTYTQVAAIIDTGRDDHDRCALISPISFPVLNA